MVSVPACCRLHITVIAPHPQFDTDQRLMSNNSGGTPIGCVLSADENPLVVSLLNIYIRQKDKTAVSVKW